MEADNNVVTVRVLSFIAIFLIKSFSITNAPLRPLESSAFRDFKNDRQLNACIFYDADIAEMIILKSPT